MKEKFFFERDELKGFFKNENERNVYIHRLKKKGRIIKINKTKYYLIPVKAFEGHWSEHPFIVIDEIFNGKGYFISGMAAAHYWGLIEQIPTQIEVICTNRQGSRRIFNFTIIFKRARKLDPKSFVRGEIKNHGFSVISKKESGRWLKSR
jgi:predicted transcriptional regulator of viral defense system